jgi:hypothetical protein
MVGIRRVRGYEFDSSADAYEAFSNGSSFKIDRERRVVCETGEIVGYLREGNVLVLEDNFKVSAEVGKLRDYLNLLIRKM